MQTADFDYELPRELIAQQPAGERASARMLVVHRGSGRLDHRRVSDLPEYLCRDDVLVVNNTRVIPARVFGRKDASGGKVEVLLIEEHEPGLWEALARCSRRPAAGSRVTLAGGHVRATVERVGEGARVWLRMECDRPLLEVLDEHGQPPLPPYIQRGYRAPDAAGGAADEAIRADRIRYQTVYAREPGAIAAPTAGLHFTPELLARLDQAGVGRSEITLHVGLGTFKPIEAADLDGHVMEAERYSVSAEAAHRIADARAASGRVVAVGTTCVRVLETVAGPDGSIAPCAGRTSIFIRPPYRFRAIDAMLTNFHLPMSTPLVMVCTLAGSDLILRAYREAVALGYRFYSYGDAMLIL